MNATENETTEMWREVKKEAQLKRADNSCKSMAILRDRGVIFRVFVDGIHLRAVSKDGLHQFDFWPSTGLWRRLHSSERGRGCSA